MNAEIRVDSLRNASATRTIWQVPGGTVSTPNAKNPGIIRFTQPGTFRITQVAANECDRDSVTRTVVVLDNPLVMLPADRTLCNRDSFTIQPRLTNSTAWAWADGFDSLRRIVMTDGVYTLSATNGQFCTARASVSLKFIPDSCRIRDTVSVQPGVSVYTPNVFRPGSPENGLFQVFVNAAEGEIVSLEVYNRWGGLVFRGEGANPTWDGTLGGRMIEPGVYVYVAVIRKKNGETVSIRGDVAVAR